MALKQDTKKIITTALAASLPDRAVKATLAELPLKGKNHIIAVGKAAWQMANAAAEVLAGQYEDGIVITKHGHSKGDIPGLAVYEAGHPVPDEDTYTATQKVINLAQSLGEEDNVVFLLSGGGSALFEKPLIPTEEMDSLTRELLGCGADIVEINTIRKRFSAVKGGRFAEICSPAKIYSVILSDVVGNRLDMIASGPACPDSSTCAEAKEIFRKYQLTLTESMAQLINWETPKELDNVQSFITGSVSKLCEAAAAQARTLGYTPVILTDCLSCAAREAGTFLGDIARKYAGCGKKYAFIAGGETVVHLTGSGLGGRNQEIALSAAERIAGLDNVCVFSVGSDGTDGPTDAAGGYCDGSTKKVLADKGISIYDTLQNNDSYHALEQCGGLIITGATGTNVNDLTVLLIEA